ncbi:MAG: polyprenyl synthetase family protein [Candidatus Binatia bacterium]
MSELKSVANFDIQNYLSTRRAAIDRALERHMKEQSGHSQSVWRAMRYGLFPGGKRIRPVLTLAAGELFGAREEVLLPFACAVEMIHAYSLIHDDLPALDDDDMRRGEPSLHKVFGEGVALLAGDGLLTEAFHLISSPEVARSLPADRVLNLMHELSHAAGAGGMVGGQAFDLEAEGKEVDLATVEYIHVRKTGALILASIRIGAQAAGAKPEELRRISRFGEYLGLAFQIADDILDMQDPAMEGEPQESGRKERKKATYPSVVGLAQAKERLRQLHEQCHAELLPFGPAAEALKGIAHQIVARATHEQANLNNQEMGS